MKLFPLSARLAVCLCALVWSTLAPAQGKIFRCADNEYINNEQAAKERGCKLIEGGNITIVPATKLPEASNGSTGSGAQARAAPSARPANSGEQRAREADRRAILETELKKLEAKQADLQKEYKNGEPERQGAESRNPQKYVERVADLKASLARTESDIVSVRGELNRLPK